MATMLILRNRAEQLRGLGLTSHGAFRVLRREFPHAERDMLVNAAGLPGAHVGVNPWWTTWGQPLRPTQIRFQLKGRPQAKDVPVVVRTIGEEPKPKTTSRSSEKLGRLVVLLKQQIEEADEMVTGAPTIRIPATKLVGGDWIEGSGEVAAAARLKDRMYVLFESGDTQFLSFDAPVEVRLEDEGSEDADD